ncbi:hypothetical protein Tco_1044457 [Tanacetum coccineum]|uniref:Reverse transcriptase Ty1/copia-type domain-containing protein n=1 Tax=Tanacetum coccineum TaxID=301880 RepID=A0ABQ5GPZ4_9ASTR
MSTYLGGAWFILGELSFFLGLQVKQKSDGIFINQDKYVAEILKKFDFASVKTASTLIETNKALVKDEEAEDVDVHLYRLMIGSLMYLTASRPDIMFTVYACARFQVTPKTSHFNAVKRIFRYLKGQHKLGRWYPRDSPFDLEAFSDSDYAVIVLTGNINRKLSISCLVVPLKKVGDEAVHKELGDRMERAATTASSLEAEQDSGSGPRCQDTVLGDVDAQTRFETISKQFNDPPLSKVNTFRSGEDSMQLMELMARYLLTKAFDVSRFNFLVASIGKRGRDTKIPQSGSPSIKVGDEAVHKELGDIMERAATTASSLEAEQESGSGPRTTTARTSANEEVELTATIDRQVKTITEASLRRHLKLEDNGGITTLPNSEIFEKLALMSNMKRISKGYSEVDIPLFLTMLTAPESSPSRITSSLSLSPQHTPVSTLSTSQPPNTQPTPNAEEAVLMPHESPLHSVHSLVHNEGSLSLNELTDLCTSLSKKVEGLESELKQTKQTYSTALTKLILRVKKLEKIVKITKARRRARIVVSEDEDAPEDSSKQGRKISDIDEDPNISLVQDEGMTWFQDADAEIKENNSADTEIILEEEQPTELVEDIGSGEKGASEVSTANIAVTTAEVSTAAENLVYIRRSAEKKKDKGKGIMTEPEPEKKTKKQLEQERLGHEEAVRLQEQLNEEETQRIARDAEIARQLHEEINKAGQERVVAKDDQAHVIDWSDPAVLRYHAQLNRPYSVAEVRKKMCIYLKNQGGFKMSHFKGMSYEEIRPIFERVWDQNQSFVPMDSEDKEKGSKKKAGGSRKKTLARKRASEKQSDQSATRQKTKYEKEKEELKAYLDLVPREEFAMDIDSLATKYPIVDWKTHVLTENFMYYQIIRVDGGSKNYKILSEMLDDFDRRDVMDLHRLVEERYATSRPEGYDLMLWGDLKILFQPDEEDEVWRHQHEYNLIS